MLFKYGNGGYNDFVSWHNHKGVSFAFYTKLYCIFKIESLLIYKNSVLISNLFNERALTFLNKSSLSSY